MRHAREIIRLKCSSVSTHEIARRLGMARSTVRETLKRTETAGLSWPLPEDMSDGALEAALYASRRSKRGHRRVAEPDWASVHRELKRKHVTLLILWDEYIAANPGGYSYSRFGVDYHVDIDAHYYSVPYRFARAEVEARLTARGVEIFHKGERIAAHLRASGNRKHTTVPEHMPSSHRRYAGWTIERIREDARKIGPATAALCEQILEARPHPEQGYRACLGIVRLVGSFGAVRVEAAAERAIEIGARTYGSVKSILDNKLDRRPAPNRPAETAPIRHPNIRGPRYYH